MLTIQQVLKQTQTQLASISSSPELEARLLLTQVLKQSLSYIYACSDKILTKPQIQSYQKLIQRRQQGEPLAYIQQQKEFWSLNFRVTPDVLIPRPETELLVELTLKLLPQETASIADLGTGSGAIIIALATEHPQWSCYATDISHSALSIARHNAKQHQCTNIQFFQSNWLQALANNSAQKFDAIISNPPYISEQEYPHYQMGLHKEPKSALVSADNGLSDIKYIARTAINSLKPQGYLLLEHGYQQGLAVMEILRQYGYTQVQSYQDLAGLDRVVCGQIN